MKKYQSFSSENVQDLEVKFSIYLHRRVFVMVLGHPNCHTIRIRKFGETHFTTCSYVYYCPMISKLRRF